MSGMDATPVLRVEALRVSYGGRTVLKDVALLVARGESVAIMGRSGSGKSTLLSCVLGMQPADAGEIFVDGERVKLRGRDVAGSAGRRSG